MKFKLDPFAITLCIDDAMRHNSIDVAINRETYYDIDQILQPPVYLFPFLAFVPASNHSAHVQE